MPIGDINDYLARMNLGQAAGLAILGVIVALAANRFLQNVADDVMSSASDLGSRLAKGIVRRRPEPFGSPWFCITCHSLNAAAANVCYRGCGRRLRQDAGLTVDVATGEPIEPPADWWTEDPRPPDG
jgi:hypothetical protein